VLEFGTEVIVSEDGSIAALLGMVAPVVVPMLRRLTSAFTPKG
jgi:hypothetical protein